MSSIAIENKPPLRVADVLAQSTPLQRGNQAGIRLPAALKALPACSASWSVLIGALVLIGWQFDLELLKRMLPGHVAMNPATAVLFIVSGISLLLWLRPGQSHTTRRAAKALAGFVAAVVLVKLSDIGVGWLPNVDEVFFTSKLTFAGDVMPNRMAPNTATVFLFIALALWSLDLSPKGWSPTHAFAIIAGFGALLPLTGYLYGVASFDGIASFIPMAVHTALTFLLLATGLFFTQTAAASHTEVFIANDSRGVLARRLFPSAVLVMLGIGWVRLWGERHGFYDNAFGTALFALLSSVVLVVLVRWTITTVGRVEAEREVAKAKLQNLNRRKDEMIAVVSHDLCSPLTGFRMVIDLMRENPERPSEELLNLMDHSAKRMVSMVRGLLDISKLQADETTLEFEQGVRVSDIIREALEPLEINASAKQITLDIEVAPEEPAICADPLRVSQIFSNLLSNAVKFTGHGGTVSVALHPDGDGVRVKVHDTGLGISEPELPHIFDKFRQTTTKATDGETGAGLGLAIVRELVLLHKGRIDVTSQVNRGTTFTVFLPGNPGLTDKQPRPIGAA